MTTAKHIAYVQTETGIWREEDGVMSGPFTREDLGLDASQYIPECQRLRCSEPVSLSFGFGYGARADNTFER
jgi:hypothetical protein